jgi:hypothetical protein
MQFSRALFFFAALTSCGRAENQNTAGAVQKSQPSSQGYSHSEEGVTGKELGLSSVNGFQYGSSVTGARTDMNVAFNSFVNYQNASGKRCSGVLAKDKINVLSGYDAYGLPIYTTEWKVFFYTARHCFEQWTPIGIRSLATIKVTSPLSYNTPWLAASAFTPSISSLSPQRFDYADDRGSDILRIPQGQLSVDKYLPICKSKDFPSSEITGFQAVGFTNPRKTTNPGVVWANLSSLLPPDLPISMQNVMTTATDSKAFKWANGLRVSPGDSGSPIWAVKRAADGVGVDRYTCLHGIVSRELWVNEGCDTSSCKMRGESVFEFLKGYQNTSAGVWKTL